METMDVVRPERQTLASHVARELSRMILEGKFVPGQRLPAHKELAGSFGVSTATIREAITSLARGGVVEARAGSGTYVRVQGVEPEVMAFWFGLPTTDEELMELVEARCIIDVGLARLAASRRSNADLEKLRGLLGQLQRAVGDLDAFVEAEVAFHMAIAEAARNRPMSRSMQAMLTLLRSSIRFSLQQGDDRMQWTVDTKRKLVDAIEARRPEEAAMMVDLLLEGAAGRAGIRPGAAGRDLRALVHPGSAPSLPQEP